MKSLNRTMQYGNSDKNFIERISLRGLNRTMQYGNWRENKPQYFPFFCLNRTMQYGNIFGCFFQVEYHLMFKSYYVVWKHSDIAFNLSALLRLNRTMQYGNLEKMKIFDVI